MKKVVGRWMERIILVPKIMKREILHKLLTKEIVETRESDALFLAIDELNR